MPPIRNGGIGASAIRIPRYVVPQTRHTNIQARYARFCKPLCYRGSNRISPPRTRQYSRGKIVTIMGRKSSAKSQMRTPGLPQPPEPPRSFPKLLLVALVAIAVAVGGLIYARARTQADAAQASEQKPPAPPPPAEVPEMNRKPHP